VLDGEKVLGVERGDAFSLFSFIGIGIVFLTRSFVSIIEDESSVSASIMELTASDVDGAAYPFWMETDSRLW